MAVRKIAISVPEDVLKDIDQLAHKTGSTRSGFITQVLKSVSHARSQTQITQRINELFGESEIADEQRLTSEVFLRAAEGEGSEW